MQADVVVVGSGPVGLAVANMLGAGGVDTLLVERNPGTNPHPRAQTMDDEGLRTVQSLGLIEAFEPLTLTAEGSRYYDAAGECFAEVGPGLASYGFAKRNYISQDQLDALLLRGLERYGNVRTLFRAEVVGLDQGPDGVELRVQTGGQTTRIAARYVLACDGGRSTIREALGIGMAGWTYAQDWVVLDALDDPDASPVSRFFCDPAGPAVSIASPGGARRYEFMLLEGQDRDAALSEASLTRFLAPFRPYAPGMLRRAAVYTFHARIAERLSDGRVHLLGDAAHLTPPFAGQGMNAGLRDAHNLAWKLVLVCRGLCTPDILVSYERERRGPIWSMIQLAVAMGEFVMPTTPTQLALKQSLLAALERFPGVKDYLFEMRFKPRPCYTDGLFVDLADQPFEASLVGAMLPQPWVAAFERCAPAAAAPPAAAAQQPVRLDELLGRGFAAVSQDAAGRAALARCAHPLLDALGARRVHLDTALGPGADAAAAAPEQAVTAVYLHDRNDPGGAARALRAHRDQVLLVRPDRYVLGACAPAELPTLCARTAAALGIKDRALT